jgi:hypothetical protein
VDELADYYDALALAHEVVRPAVYLEIGVHHGDSLRLAHAGTLAIGVDPEMDLRFDVVARAHLFHETSDEFFAQHADDVFAGAPIDLAFVDGLHHWEQTLRDFAHVERHSHPGGCALIHDCLPIDAETSTREHTTLVWSGDVWKVAVWLRRHRPDLTVTTVDVAPTGLAVVTGLDPGRTPPGSALEELDADLGRLGYDDVAESLPEILNVVPGTRSSLQGALAAR